MKRKLIVLFFGMISVLWTILAMASEEKDKWNVSVTVPCIYQETGSAVASIEGRPVQIRRTTGVGNRTSTEGLGDIILKGGYDLLEEPEQPFNLSAVAKIKLPTANKDDGLGTGEFDEGVGLEASKRLDSRWTFLGDLYYTFIGSPLGWI